MVPAVVAGIAAMTLWGLAIALIGIVGPKFVEMYRDFGLSLPGYSRVFVGVAELMRLPWVVGLVVLAPLTITVALAAAAIRGDRAGLVVLVLFALSALLVIGGFRVAMVIPAARMIEAAQSSGSV